MLLRHLGLLPGVWFLLTPLALAQSEDAVSTSLPDVTVSATKRPQTLYHLDGMADSVEAQDALDRNLRSVMHLDRLFPDTQILQRSGAPFANLTVRGQSSPDFFNPSTQLYIDGLPQDQAALGQLLPLDADRIELLYGPQGTLYGRGAVGGVLSITTRRPNDELKIGGLAGAGSLNREAAAQLSGPLVTRQLYGDIALGYQERSGAYRTLFEDRIGDTDNHSGRLRLRYAPTGQAFDVMATANRIAIASDEELYVTASDRRSRKILPAPSHYRLALDNFGLDSHYDFGFAKLSAITGYQDRALDRTLMGYPMREDQRTVSQEVRLASTPSQGEALDYILGAYYQNLDWYHNAIYAQQITRQGIDSTALFAEATWHVTPAFDIAPGMRLDHERADFKTVGPFIYNGRKSFSALSPKLSLGYQLSPGLRVYSLYSSGYKAGGFTRVASDPSKTTLFYDPQKTHNFEIGGKGRLLNGRLSWSTAAYYTITNDYQLFVGETPNQYLKNAGDVTSKGLDIKLTAYPTEELRLVAGLGLNHAEFTRHVDPTGSRPSYKGKTAPYAPQVTARVSADYTILLPGEWGSLAPRAGVSYSGKTYFNEANDMSEKGYALLDAGLTWVYNEHLSLLVYGDNLTDKIYSPYGFAGFGGSYYQLSSGREIGARLKVTF